MKSRKAASASLLLIGCVFLKACAGAGVLTGLAMDVGRSLMMDTAEENFGIDYSAHMERMLDALIAPAATYVPVEAAVLVEEPGEPVEIAEPEDSAEPQEVFDPVDPPDAMAETIEIETVEVDPGPPAIELEVVVLREVIANGRPVPVPLNDGDIIRDGIGREESGDNLKIRFRTNVDCYIYAIWVDATAWTTPVYPPTFAEGSSHRVQGGENYFVPHGSDWFYLDDYRGVESLFVVASHEPMIELEAALQEFAGLERNFLADHVAVLEKPAEVTRGLGGVREGSSFDVEASDGSEHLVPSRVFLGGFEEGGDLVVTRWFRHE